MSSLPKLDRDKELMVWIPQQAGTFLSHVAEDRLAPLYVLAATTGMRRGELLGSGGKTSTSKPRRRA